jgi:hypothetical protein
MTGWGDKLKGLFGGKPKSPHKKAAPAKTYKDPSNRAAVIAEAMEIHRRGRAHAQGVLEAALQEMRKKPPRPSDLAAMTRLLSLRQAVLTMKGHMAHDLKRYQVLAGVKGLLESAGGRAGQADAPANPKSPPGRGPSQGSKR